MSAQSSSRSVSRRRGTGVIRARRRTATAVLALACTLWGSATAFAQLDPLLFVKRVPPTVIVVFDTSLRMLDDGQGNVYDPFFYSATTDPAVMPAFPNIDPSTTATYRRIYQNLQYAPGGLGNSRYTTDQIRAVPAVWDPAKPLTSNSPADTAFLDPTRYAIAKAGLDAAVSENAGSTYRWGLIRLRQSTPQWRTAANCEKPVSVADAFQGGYGDKTPCDAVGLLKREYGIYAPSVAVANYSNTTAPAGTMMVTPSNNTSKSVLNVVRRPIGDNLGLVPASRGDVGFEDRPLAFALTDARAATINAMAVDSAANRSCRNTVVVLITSGKNEGDATYLGSNSAVNVAKTFLSVSGSGVTKRVPIHVIGVKPPAADEAELRSIASESGGVYTNATSAAAVAAAVNYAVQTGFARATDFDGGNLSEFSSVSPIVGTVNMKNGRSALGAALPNTDIKTDPGDTPIPQRSNVLISAGFTLPGFEGRMRAFRVYKPEPDSTKPTGWKFVNDGTRLWPDLDGRPQLAGLARTPADPGTRNVYTFIPSGAGGGSVVAFDAANAATLEPHLQTSGSDTTDLISFVRSQPIGAIIGSTPGLMDPPSLDPPPDDDYGRADGSPLTFAGSHTDRRGIIFFGANDGMIHAVDARTGYEVWAFIPYNLLPKLRALSDGQPVEQFDYFVDSSPKIAEVKLNGAWRSLLIIGQGQGGTFYQAFDVTEAGMGVQPDLDDIGAVNALLSRFDTPDESIQFKWAFPDYSHFDPTYTKTHTVTDGWPGGKLKLYGDVSSSASFAEKTVGFSWSDPAVGPLDVDRNVNAVIVGSGYFPAVETLIPNRGLASAPAAGSTLYLVNADTGQLVGNPAGTACAGVGCLSLDDVAANGRKNAIQADPTAAGESGSHVVTKAYIGDVDGRYWRFNFDAGGALTRSLMAAPGIPIYASSALLFVGSADVYMFFATGSDLLAPSSPGGSGVFRLYGLKDNYPASGATTKIALDLATVSGSGALTTGERPSTSPSVAGDIVFYTTTTENGSTPCADFTAKLYALTYAGGSAYDTDNSGKIENNESPVVKTLAGRATAPFIVDQHLYFATAGANGAAIEAFGDPEDFNNGIGQVGVRILSWREIR